jgi:DNA (cytosine-5)-methyltransferase 1
MKVGGLFSGIGGFELAFTQLGGEVAWMCEYDPKARKVLEARFPGVPVYPDVRELDPNEVEPVDVLTGGSPCQGFSVAGTRSGLEHDESRLFADYVRIMEGLAERGLRWALWENVPGVLSIEDEYGERTFEHVVAALAGGAEPVRLDRNKRWNAGLAAGRSRTVAWRVLDSRHFGVAQRRRRVFAAVAFGGSNEDRAVRSLLVVPEGVRRDTPPSFETREGSSGGASFGAASPGGELVPKLSVTLGAQQRGGQDIDGTKYLPDLPKEVAFGMYGNSGVEGATVETQPAITASHGQPGNVAVPQGFRMTAFGEYEDDESASTIKQRDYKDATDLVIGPPVMMHIRGGVETDSKGRKAGKGPLLSYELSATLDATQPWTLFEPRAFRKATRARSTEDPETWVEDGSANTLNTFDLGDTRTTHAVLEETPVKSDKSQDLPEPKAFDEMNFSLGEQHQVLRAGTVQSTGALVPYVANETGTLQARTFKGLNHENVPDGQAVVQSYGVRRLTPVECERLQAFPDGWTEPAGSDSARYKTLGNAVTVNTVRWVLGRMLEADRTTQGENG